MDDLDDVRMDVLQRLAEQAMGDPDFRAFAREDLLGALMQYGYDLTEKELGLVTRFRQVLADAGVDLRLDHPISPEDLRGLMSTFS